MFKYNLERELQKSLFGNIFFLRDCKFRRCYDSININKYFESFSLGDKYIGKFYCDIKKGGYKRAKEVWSYDSNVQIFNKNYSKLVLNEDLKLIKRTLSIKEIPTIDTIIKYNDKTILFDQIPSEIYSLLLNKSDRDIIHSFTKNL